ncbi:MAG: hypothetical protein ABIQ40_04470 [Bacteroidia bacterium]
MKKFIACLAFALRITTANADTFNVENISPTSGNHACTYTVTVYISAVSHGSPISLTPQSYSLAPLDNHNFTFTPPSGYALDLSTLYFVVTCRSTPSNCNITFYSASSNQQCNCYTSSNADEVTVWSNTGSNLWKISADLIV